MTTRLVLLALLAAGFAHAAGEPKERVPLRTVVPEYPEEARQDRLEGEVQVCFHIDRGGRPYRIAVRRSTLRLFERPSTAAVRASTYVPLEPDEELPAMKTCRTFHFRLNAQDPVQPPPQDPGGG